MNGIALIRGFSHELRGGAWEESQTVDIINQDKFKRTTT